MLKRWKRISLFSILSHLFAFLAATLSAKATSAPSMTSSTAAHFTNCRYLNRPSKLFVPVNLLNSQFLILFICLYYNAGSPV
jgi:hypothetical protein